MPINHQYIHSTLEKKTFIEQCDRVGGSKQVAGMHVGSGCQDDCSSLPLLVVGRHRRSLRDCAQPPFLCRLNSQRGLDRRISQSVSSLDSAVGIVC